MLSDAGAARSATVWESEWGRFSDAQGEWKELALAAHHQLSAVVSELAADAKRPAILEAGCGSALLSTQIARQYGADLHLVDLSDGALRVARRNAKEHKLSGTTVARGDLLRLPYSDDSFDLVYNGGVNEHFAGKDRVQAFAEMLRVCRVGGQVLVHVPNAACVPYRIGKWLLERSGRWRWGLEIPYSRTEINGIIGFLGAAPATIEAAGDSSFAAALTWVPPFALIRRTPLRSNVETALKRLRFGRFEDHYAEWLSVRFTKCR